MDAGRVMVLVLVVLALIPLTIWGVIVARKAAYVRRLRERGWVFTERPSVAVAYGLNQPPFGMGFGRGVDDLVEGTTRAGVPFRAFEYAVQGYGSPGYVVTMPIGPSLPPFFMMRPERPRAGVTGVRLPGGEPYLVVASNPAFAEAALQRAGTHLQTCGSQQFLDVSIDGTQLVALGAPKEPAELPPFLENLAFVATGQQQAQLDEFAVAAPPAEMSFTTHPEWVYRPNDPGALEQVSVTRGGHSHEARDVIYSSVDEIPFVALTHHWKTDRTETSTDANGNTSTRVVTDNHVEQVMELVLPFPFMTMSVNRRGGGEKVAFEKESFNRAYTVRAASPRFASDVFHPRQIEYVERFRPPPFLIQNGRMYVTYDGTLPLIEAWQAFAEGFFGRVPAFTWKELGVAPPRFMLEYES